MKIFCALLFSIIFGLHAHSVFAQKEGNIWCFGANAGLNFNSGNPVSFPGVQMQQQEGSSSIADTSGNLLFYSDGVTVWDRNNVAMPNGTGLWGGNSSTQSALIVKQPGNSNIYYLFTPTEANGPNGLSYSIVDISLNSGLGDVTLKNIQLFTPSSEKVCATHHANGVDIWIMGHEEGTNGFRSYLLTATGLSTPVITNIGMVFPLTNNGVIGYMKFSHDGNRLATAIRWSDTLELFDFDKSNAVVTNHILSYHTTATGPYGIEFSPDDSKLYYTDSRLNQFDLSSGNAATIAASRDSVGTSLWALQLASNHKIYGVDYTRTTLDVINDPNQLGSACNFVAAFDTLATGTCRIGLPGFVSDLFNTSHPPVSVFTSSDTVFCDENGRCLDFTDHSTGNPTSWQWLFPGANPDTSSLQNPTNICYTIPGTYSVTLITTNTNGADTLTVPSLIVLASAPLPPVVTTYGDTVTTTHYDSYQWYFNGFPISGATDSSYVATQSGTYSVRGTDSLGCSSLSNGVYVDMTAVNIMANEGEIRIFPNPTKGEFTVYGLPFTVGWEIELCDALGQKVFELKHDGNNSNRETVDSKSLGAGIYFLTIRAGDRMMNKKIIIEK